ncbi:MAG: 23S rRNA (pseudouridine(1915)-N(3))-methyltransferase RlmH [Acidimicrobiia bacterium]|nr:23S rRNA (pseudouridine(1915)-N(3))-methyltransferase RlmH [Acidimicrobiia bacterium]MDH5503887.1 23S rRNA (pseudouridine(1915)-N(3))-methyltransferase RlmH [Acidimicrobiia bacterium]
MRYRIVAVGQLKRGFYEEGCAFYLDRLQRVTGIEVLEIKDGKDRDGDRRKAAESASLLEQADGRVVALDERGKQFGSEDLAQIVSLAETQAVSRLSFLIGGADGHSAELLNRADEVWRLSDLTLPHELARLVLLEQLYRAEMIRSGHPYHRA